VFRPRRAVTSRLFFPADAGGTSLENERAPALFEMFDHRSLLKAPASKSSCRRTRGSAAMPRSPGYFRAMPSAGAAGDGGS